MEDLKNKEFVVFDVETTGLSPQTGDRIVELAALKVKNFKTIDEFHSLIDPGRQISFGAFEVNGITDEMLAGKPKSREILPLFLRFLGKAVLVGHNVAFDLSFLLNELALIDLKLKEHTVVVDTLKMSRMLLPHLGRYPLWFVAESLAVGVKQSHRAMADVQLTYRVFSKLITLAQKKGVDDADKLLSLFSDRQFAYLKEDENKISLIKEAIAREKVLSLMYYSRSSASMTSRKVTPKELVFKSDKVTLVGLCHLRQQDRDFRIDRIVHVESI